MQSAFRAFLVRGNVVDLAVGVILGGAFGRVVTSLVNDVLMPPLGLVVGGVDTSGLFVELGTGHHTSLAEAKQAGAATLNYGIFINTIVDFVCIAGAVFLLLRGLARLSPPKPSEPAMRECHRCKMSIPLAATRCGHCTSDLPDAVTATG